MKKPFFWHMRKQRRRSDCFAFYDPLLLFDKALNTQVDMSFVMRKPDFFVYAKTKTQISFAVTAKRISAFVFRYKDSTIPHLS